jgi:hypothetical protein
VPELHRQDGIVDLPVEHPVQLSTAVTHVEHFKSQELQIEFDSKYPELQGHEVPEIVL